MHPILVYTYKFDYLRGGQRRNNVPLALRQISVYSGVELIVEKLDITIVFYSQSSEQRLSNLIDVANNHGWEENVLKKENYILLSGF